MNILDRRMKNRSGGVPAHSAAKSRIAKSSTDDAPVKDVATEPKPEDTQVATDNDVAFTAPVIESEPVAADSEATETEMVSDIVSVSDTQHMALSANALPAAAGELGFVISYGGLNGARDMKKLALKFTESVDLLMERKFRGSQTLCLNGVILAGLGHLEALGKNLNVNENYSGDKWVLNITEVSGDGCVNARGVINKPKERNLRDIKLAVDSGLDALARGASESGRDRLRGNRALAVNGLIQWYLGRLESESKRLMVEHAK